MFLRVLLCFLFFSISVCGFVKCLEGYHCFEGTSKPSKNPHREAHFSCSYHSSMSGYGCFPSPKLTLTLFISREGLKCIAKSFAYYPSITSIVHSIQNPPFPPNTKNLHIHVPYIRLPKQCIYLKIEYDIRTHHHHQILIE